MVRVAILQAAEDVGARHLLRIVPGEPAELLVAENSVVRAHPLLGADLKRVKRALVHGRERRDCHLLLQRFGRQEDDLAAALESGGQRRMERGGGFAGSGRRLRQENLMTPDRLIDRFDEPFLDFARSGMGKRKSPRGFRLPLARRRLRLPDVQQLLEAPLHLPVELRLVVRHGKRNFLARRDVDVDERAGDL